MVFEQVILLQSYGSSCTSKIGRNICFQIIVGHGVILCQSFMEYCLSIVDCHGILLELLRCLVIHEVCCSITGGHEMLLRCLVIHEALLQYY